MHRTQNWEMGRGNGSAEGNFAVRFSTKRWETKIEARNEARQIILKGDETRDGVNTENPGRGVRDGGGGGEVR
jgi:hypothetical protein